MRVHWIDDKTLVSAAALLASAYPDENWTGDDLVRFLTGQRAHRKRHAVNGGKVIVDALGRVVAVALVGTGRRCVRLRRLAVRPEQRRRGLGRVALEWAVGEHSGVVRQRILARVPEDNLEAQIFLRALGFRCGKTKRTATRDVYVFGRAVRVPETPVPTPAAHPAPNRV